MRERDVRYKISSTTRGMQILNLDLVDFPHTGFLKRDLHGHLCVYVGLQKMCIL